MKKICITGPEATGKSTLARGLADFYGCHWVSEYARLYLEKIRRPYKADDLDAIARGQCHSEAILEEKSSSSPYLFCDTGPEVVWVWSLYKYGAVSSVIEDLTRSARYDLTLLLDVDLPWVEDPLRENPSLPERRHLLQMYKDLLQDLNRPYRLIQGSGSERLEQAKRCL